VRPHAFLPQHVRIVAGVAAVLVRSVSAGPRRPGTVVTVSLNRSTVGEDLVVGCHGCPRCGGEPVPRADLGTLLGLRRLRHLEKEGAANADFVH